MTITIIITLCILLLIAYVFDLTSAKTRIPSVILLLLLGWAVKQFTLWFGIKLPDFSNLLPILGTFGLILIVLEGALELDVNQTKFLIIRKSIIGAVFHLIVLAFLLAAVFYFSGDHSFKDSLTNAIPFCVISSAIAIPSVRNQRTSIREFVTYESSLSDILGVLIFNFLILNQVINFLSFSEFLMQLLVMALISFLATIGLSLLLNRIEHHVKFIPIILLIILIYSVSEVFHLPGLILILIFGLFIVNLDELKRFQWIDRLRPDNLNQEAIKFKELVIEATFLVRASFFLLFGYLIETSDVINLTTIPWATGIVLLIFALRAIQLKLSNLPMNPLLFVAPRGLITILLFLNILPSHRIPLVNESLVIQVILLTAVSMMPGLLASRAEPVKNSSS
jgi:hypothetical protein